MYPGTFSHKAQQYLIFRLQNASLRSLPRFQYSIIYADEEKKILLCNDVVTVEEDDHIHHMHRSCSDTGAMDSQSG